MARIVASIAAIWISLPAFALAQVSPGASAVDSSTPPAVGQSQTLLPAPSPNAGLNKTAKDGVSTVTVPAVPCSTSARGTDGTTTCVGIPGPIHAAPPTGSVR